MDIGKRVRDAREARGLTQEGLARRAGVPLNRVGRIETGTVTDPHYSTLSRIADGLGLSVGELLEGPSPLAPAPSASPLRDVGAAEAGQPEDAALAVLFRGLAQRGWEIVEQSVREGASERLGRKLVEYQKEAAALRRIAGGRDILGKRSEEFHEAQDAYEEVESRIQALLAQDVAGGGEEVRTRRLRSGQGAGDARTEAG